MNPIGHFFAPLLYLTSKLKVVGAPNLASGLVFIKIFLENLVLS